MTQSRPCCLGRRRLFFVFIAETENRFSFAFVSIPRTVSPSSTSATFYLIEKLVGIFVADFVQRLIQPS